MRMVDINTIDGFQVRLPASSVTIPAWRMHVTAHPLCVLGVPSLLSCMIPVTFTACVPLVLLVPCMQVLLCSVLSAVATVNAHLLQYFYRDTGGTGYDGHGCRCL